MAKIEHVQTGLRVETRIRGRVFAPRSKKAKAPRERRMVCVLNRHDGRMLEHWDTSQPCFGPQCRHSHQTREEVQRLVADGILRYMPGSNNNVASYSFGRTWKGVPSGLERMKVMQLV